MPPQPAGGHSMEPTRHSFQGPSSSAGVSSTPFQTGTVPPRVNQLGAIPLGHYPSGQILFLAPHFGVFSVPVMAMLSLPNLTLGIPIWYIDPHYGNFDV